MYFFAYSYGTFIVKAFVVNEDKPSQRNVF